MRVVFMGTPDFAVGTLTALAEAGHEIVGVVSQPDKPKGRGKALMPTPVKEEALRLGLPVYQPAPGAGGILCGNLKIPSSGCDCGGGLRSDHTGEYPDPGAFGLCQRARVPASQVPGERRPFSGR